MTTYYSPKRKSPDNNRAKGKKGGNIITRSPKGEPSKDQREFKKELIEEPFTRANGYDRAGGSQRECREDHLRF